MASLNFFKENSTEHNSDFWETELFAKVVDLKKDPEWDKYGETIWESDELNNRPYIGEYEIVANTLRIEAEEENAKFYETTEPRYSEFYSKLKSTNPKEFTNISVHSLVFPIDRSVTINPILATDNKGKKTLRYYVIVNGSSDIYEWTYFQPKEIPEDEFGNQVIEQIGSLTNWNFSADNLNDSEFWNNYVLKKANDVYVYLNKL
ncbi:hypothetical protein [Sphingobacterium hungaricum]